ncbi:MAG: regulatory protein RecX [Acidaminococcaceae bacterium]|nr:regulatory protein RecX [Acidaminococcaceae bacterium]
MTVRSKPPITTMAMAYDFALTKLSYRDHSQQDLEGKLRMRQCPQEIIDQVVIKLKHYKLLNEENYGNRVYQGWLSKKYYGRSHLQLTLLKKQVDKNIIDIIVHKLTAEEEEERAIDFGRNCLKKNSAKFDLTSEKGRVNLARALATRGFGGYIIKKTLKQLE